MCLSVPGKVIEIGERFVLEYPGEERSVEISLVDLIVGDYVIVSGGVIISKVDEEKAVKFLEILDD
ncbi:MAG: HypC/HybG/HupF family hydrogenase formation chaperone [Nanoarchaeota archaeon]|nr:HypC/HybG/HupF family hydrogenase formation chaperone [Nanoarchaeota archaeon]